jgi:hypothetical protein
MRQGGVRCVGSRTSCEEPPAVYLGQIEVRENGLRHERQITPSVASGIEPIVHYIIKMIFDRQDCLVLHRLRGLSIDGDQSP